MISNRIAVPIAEVKVLRQNCAENVYQDYKKYPGMSYEEGIIAVIDWLFGDLRENPYDVPIVTEVDV